MELYRSFINTGLFFIGGGLLSGTGGGIAMYLFIRRSATQDDFTVGELARGMIVPHIFMFVGLGVAVYGTMLVVRGFVLRRRQREMLEERNGG